MTDRAAVLVCQKEEKKFWSPEREANDRRVLENWIRTTIGVFEEKIGEAEMKVRRRVTSRDTERARQLTAEANGLCIHSLSSVPLTESLGMS